MGTINFYGRLFYMNTALLVGGPLILALTATFLIGSGIVTFGEVAGLELEQESIEYREGDEITTVRKQNGLSKYANITLRWPTGLDESWKFIFENKAKRDNCPNCNVNTEVEAEAGAEMFQIDPPVMVIPTR